MIADPHRDFIYDVLPHLPLDLAVDVGAAAGEHTLRIHSAGHGAASVVAFEPFPGNHPLFTRAVADLSHVTLVTKALSDRSASHVAFVVPSVVQGDEPGWQEKPGYSSVGFLASRVPVLKRVKWTLLVVAGRLTRKPRTRRSSVIHVETTSLDQEFVGKRIDYLKIDVQGAEADVLRGARTLLADHAIGVIYVEWPGGEDVPAILSEHGYEIFDSVYVAGGHVRGDALEEIGFRYLRDVPLSIGTAAVELALTPAGPEPREAMQLARRSGLRWIQTDLIAVSPTLAADFRAAVAAAVQ